MSEYNDDPDFAIDELLHKQDFDNAAGGKGFVFIDDMPRLPNEKNLPSASGVKLESLLSEFRKWKFKTYRPKPPRRPYNIRDRWEREMPIGCGLDRATYDERFRVLRLYLPHLHKPSMGRTIRFAAMHWPDARWIVCLSGAETCANYRRCPAGHEDGHDVDPCGWWRSVRPGCGEHFIR